MTPARRAAPYIGLWLLCIAVYWYAFRAWFFLDDFAWLGLKLEIHSARDLWLALFEPRAQGTIRTLGERLPFLAFPALFGWEVWPFRLLTFATQFVNLGLMYLIVGRLTGSALAGFAASVFWIFCAAMALPMEWASAYNQVLCACVLLFCFWCLLRFADTGDRRYWTAQWIVYLLGFGVLELNVVYPAIALLYVVLFASRLVRRVLWLFVPAILFTIAHFALIPKANDPIYRMYFDASLPGTFYKLLAWSLGPTRLGYLIHPQYRQLGFTLTALIAAGLLAFLFRRAAARDSRTLIFGGWFVLLVAPLVPLKNHLEDYYPAVPAIGICMLGGWAFASAWKTGVLGRVVAVALALAYAGGNYVEILSQTKWYAGTSRRMRTLLETASSAQESAPLATVLLDGIDWDLYACGFNDQPFRLYGIQRAYILPGNVEALEKNRSALRGMSGYRISDRDASDMLARGDAVALTVVNGRIVNTTRSLRAVLGAAPKTERSQVNAGDPAESGNLGGDWYNVENGYRWMGRSATVRLAAPSEGGKTLVMSGYAPAAVLAAGPLHLTVSADAIRLGRIVVNQPNQPFEATLAVPASFTGKPALMIGLEVDRTTVLPNEGRQLGLIFGRFEIR